jgi:hypothetical protein
MPLIATRGAASVQGFGEFAQTTAPVYIEDVFSTYLYTGNGSTQTITNGIDLSTKGGLVWIKNRSLQDFGNTRAHWLFDSARTAGYSLSTNSTSAQSSVFGGLIPFSTTGFSINTSDPNLNGTGSSAYTYASWTFREQPKFFDIVTYTGTGSARSVSHNLGSTPGCIIIKCTSNADQWIVYHRSTGTSKFLYLNTTGAEQTYSWISSVGSTSFTLNDDSSLYNANGRTYVAYLFAHDAGGFGLTGSDNVITCGSYTGNGLAPGPTITLGYEPQWIMIKRTDAVGNWFLYDNMRGWPVGSDARELYANDSYQEDASSYNPWITSTGFYPRNADSRMNAAGGTYIYIAIRRGPMKTPTSGTSVFAPNTYAGGTAGRSFSLGFVPDALLTMRRNTSNFDILQSRLTGLGYMFTNATDAEIAATSGMPAWDAPTNTISLATATSVTGWNASGSNYVNEAFARAPGFFDVVCYTGTSANRTLNHNLGVAPELIIQKSRAPDPGVVANYWLVGTNFGASNYRRNWLQLTDVGTTYTYAAGAGFFSQPTSTTFGITDSYNASGTTYIVYLFATLAGVSKVGSYTGSTSVQTINCGFTNGARFVLIKRTDAAGNWIVYDSARGIVAGNDPYLLLNTTGAEDDGDDDLEADSSGFIVNPTPDGISNPGINGATYIFLAIA